jgi:hypothetical protein
VCVKDIVLRHLALAPAGGIGRAVDEVVDVYAGVLRRDNPGLSEAAIEVRTNVLLRAALQHFEQKLARLDEL